MGRGSPNGVKVILEERPMVVPYTLHRRGPGVGVVLIGSEGDVRQFRTACGSCAGNRASPRAFPHQMVKRSYSRKGSKRVKYSVENVGIGITTNT